MSSKIDAELERIIVGSIINTASSRVAAKKAVPLLKQSILSDLLALEVLQEVFKTDREKNNKGFSNNDFMTGYNQAVKSFKQALKEYFGE